MLISARYVVDRLRLTRGRADDVRAVRRRLAEQPRRASDDENALAVQLRALRQELSRALGALQSCGTCARGATPAGWDGGLCCSGDTRELFDDNEIAALRAAGTRPGHLQAARDDDAGCAFRGRTACSLDVAHRPNRCVGYVCDTAAAELYDRGDLDAIDDLRDQLAATFERFAAARDERLLDEAIGLPMRWRRDYAP